MQKGINGTGVLLNLWQFRRNKQTFISAYNLNLLLVTYFKLLTESWRGGIVCSPPGLHSAHAAVQCRIASAPSLEKNLVVFYLPSGMSQKIVRNLEIDL